MTIVVNVTVPEGLVFAADSRMSYTNSKGDVRVRSDYARKLFQLNSRVAAVTWGWAFLLGRNIHSHVNDYKISLGGENLPVEEMAKGLGQYLQQQYQKHIEQKYDKPVDKGNYATGLLLGGFDPGGKTGKLFELYVPDGEYYQRRTTSESPGAGWRGHTLVISRLFKGFDPRIREMQGFTPELGKLLDESQLDYDVNYWSMPLQDAVDLSIFLVHTTIQTERFTDGIFMSSGASATCGGPIDVAVIDPENGFQWIQNKTIKGERQQENMGNSET